MVAVIHIWNVNWLCVFFSHNYASSQENEREKKLQLFLLNTQNA